MDANTNPPGLINQPENVRRDDETRVSSANTSSSTHETNHITDEGMAITQDGEDESNQPTQPAQANQESTISEYGNLSDQTNPDLDKAQTQISQAAASAEVNLGQSDAASPEDVSAFIANQNPQLLQQGNTPISGISQMMEGVNSNRPLSPDDNSANDEDSPSGTEGINE